MQNGWRFFAKTLTGDGTEGSMIHADLPLANPQVTRTLSGPSQITGDLQLPPSLRTSDGDPLIAEWGAAVYAELNGELVTGGIVTNAPLSNGSMALDVTGFSSYPKGMPFTDSTFFVETDALDIVRAIWDHLQSKAGGDLGVTYNTSETSVRIGTEHPQTDFDPNAPSLEQDPNGSGPLQFDDGPYKLNWYTTTDLGQNIDDLAKGMPFDYREELSYGPSENIIKFIDFAYPYFREPRGDLRFVVGENIDTAPEIDADGEHYASEVLVLGRGEGRVMKRGYARRSNEDRVRRVAVVTDKTASTKLLANWRAKHELGFRDGRPDLATVSIIDHANAPFYSWNVGDIVMIEGDVPGATIRMRVRILADTYDVRAGKMTLSISRLDKVVDAS